MITFPPIGPNEVLSYGINWQPRLGSDTISTSVWSASTPPGLVFTNKSNTATATSLFIAGAVVDTTYTFTNTITTAAGATEIENVQLTCSALK